MSANSVKDALQNFGLTQKESQIYIFLAKHGPQGGGQISDKTKTAKAVTYRTLKILQRKGFVESTLESPARYAAVPFEAILDQNIKAKQLEASQIESAKNDLLSDWSKISRGKPETPTEKFTVIEGTQKIYNKIYQMVRGTHQQMNIIASPLGIMKADRYGITDAIINHPKKDRVRFRFITDINDANKKQIQLIKSKVKTGGDIRGRNPEIGLEPFPRMVIRDNQEILFFTTQKIGQTKINTDETCLTTNCRSMIEAFSGVFEDLWDKSTDIERKVAEVQAENLAPETAVISDKEKAKNHYLDSLNRAEKEIFIVTSSAGLLELSRHLSLFKEFAERDIEVKFMAPITTDNLAFARSLLQCCEIRHIPLGYYETTIIDEVCLLQFSNPLTQEKDSQGDSKFGNMLYTTDVSQVRKTKKLLNEIWLTTRMPLSERADQIIDGFLSQNHDLLVDHHDMLKKTSFMQNMKERQREEIGEKDVLGKIDLEKDSASPERRGWMDTLRYFGQIASAIIEPPMSFNLPRMVFSFCRYEEPSTFGDENMMMIFLKKKVNGGLSYVPSAVVLNRSETLDLRRKMIKGFPAEDNVVVVDKDELQFQFKGNTFFAGWTKPIPLKIDCFIIPPSCVLFEGYGNVKSGSFNNRLVSGRSQEVWYNSVNAFVTYFHPQSKYTGSGTEGYIEKDWCLISYPPAESV